MGILFVGIAVVFDLVAEFEAVLFKYYLVGYCFINFC
jgi:hypothetical protein